MENKINVKLLSMAGQGGSAFGISLMNLMKERDDLMVLSSDMSTPAGLDKFKAAYPDHFMNMGIAEQNMIGTAAGLVEEGYKAICVAQACFITMRSFEQIRQYAGYMKLPIIIMGIGSGLSLQYMGNTHYAIEDLALMRAVPGMTVLAPCDALEAMKAMEFAVDHNGPVYIRFYGGTGIPSVYSQDYDFKAGEGIRLQEGKDVQIIAAGSMVLTAIKAANMLRDEGIETSVTNMHTVKPLDYSAIDLDKKLIVTLEEHSIMGGLGSAVADFLSAHPQHPTLLKLGINDTFMPVGSYAYLMGQAGLAPEKIRESIIKELNN